MKAIVAGSTGMTGRELIKQLVDNNEYTLIVSLVRRESGIKHPKLNEYVVNFDEPEQWQHLAEGDVLFSCMGTTLKKAGSKAAQYKIDFTYQYETAKAAANNGVKKYVLVSSAGATTKSPVFYSCMKGELDQAVGKLNFDTTVILRPGQLYGEREEKRNGELWAIKIMFALNKLGIFRKYRPLHASDLAKAMINAVKKAGYEIFTLHEVHNLVNETY